MFLLLVVSPFIGSWLGVLVRRWPAGQPVAIDRSRCAHCGHVLGPLELAPLVSFAVQRGRCRHCRAAIGWFYPAIELAALAVAVAAVYADGDTVQAWVDAGLGWALLCAAWIDAETFRLPDVITLPLVLAGLGATWVEQAPAIYNHAAAAAAGYVGFRLADGLYYLIRKRHGLGAGDAKLLAAAGAWLGLAALPDVVLGAGIIGLAGAVLVLGVRGLRGSQAVAFGPALALAFFWLRIMP